MKRRSGVPAIVRLASRILFALGAAVVLTLVSIQYARIINQNIAMARSLSSIQRDVRTLRHLRGQDERELRRLSNPVGAIPEIHDRLHMVRSNEAIIYLKPASTPRP